MYNNLTDEKLEQLGIYELRSLARTMGVVSPTSKKREQLITEIRNIKNGFQKPVFNNRFGRPVKSINSQGDLFSNFIIKGDKELEQLIKPQVEDDSYIVLDQNIDLSKLPLTTNLIEIRGILRKTDTGTFYLLDTLKLKTRSCVLFDAQDIKNYDLIVGDMIHGTAFVYQKQGYAKIKDISEINGVVASKNSYSYDYEPAIPSIELDSDFMAGQSRLCKIKDTTEALDLIAKRAKKYKSKGYKCIVLGLEISIETKLKLDRIQEIDDVVSLLDDESSFSLYKINDCLNHALSLFYHNFNVVVFVMDVIGIYHILDTLYQSPQSVHAEKTELTLRKLLANSRASETASISTCCLYFENQETSFAREIELLTKTTRI